VDVLVSSLGLGAAEYPEMQATPDGMLHVIWTTGGERSNLLYARVNACCASDVSQWTKPVYLSSPVNLQPHLTGDSQGNLYVAYADFADKEIYVMHSLDGGDTWSEPVQVPGGIKQPGEESVYPRLAVGKSGRVHLVWSVLPWPGQSIWYSYSDDHGDAWSNPIKIDDINNGKYEEGFGPIVVDVQVRSEKEVHLIWDGAPTVERNHIYSLDDGETWSKPDIVFPQITLSGRAGWNEMATDSAGTLYAVSILGPQISGWDGKGWSVPQDIATRNYLGDGEMMRLRVGLGNQLHVIWLDRNTAPFSVWYVHGIALAPPVAAQAISTPQAAQIALSPTPAATLTSMAAVTEPWMETTGMGKINQLAEYNPGGAILAGVVPSALIILFLIFRHRSRQ
jgi:hypothetical protein